MQLHTAITDAPERARLEGRWKERLDKGREASSPGWHRKKRGTLEDIGDQVGFEYLIVPKARESGLETASPEGGGYGMTYEGVGCK